MRAMMRMFTTTYGESVSCTPICDMGEPMGPMLNGSTYMVRPAMQPLNRAFSVFRISKGFTQLFVGPAASFDKAQMNVRSSTRATSVGSERARKQPGHVFRFNLMKVPAVTICAQRSSYSVLEPSTQWIAAG